MVITGRVVVIHLASFALIWLMQRAATWFLPHRTHRAGLEAVTVALVGICKNARVVCGFISVPRPGL